MIDQENERLRKIQDLREAVRDAFPLRPIPHWPLGRASVEEVHCRRHLRGKSWERVDFKVVLTQCDECLDAMPSLEALAYYLPSFLDALLISWAEARQGWLYRNTKYFFLYWEERKGLATALTKRQRNCVAALLDLMADDEGELSDEIAILRIAAEDWASDEWAVKDDHA